MDITLTTPALFFPLRGAPVKRLGYFYTALGAYFKQE
jgi:hypothetical protein